jgi:hypothetical protein
MTRETGDASFVDPKEFLARPSYRSFDSTRLSSGPTIDLLKWSPTLPDEAGFVLRNGVWILIKGGKEGIPSYLIPPDSDVFIHSHPEEPDESTYPSFIPSVRDYLNAWAGIRNFVTSVHGLTRFWGITNPDTKKELEAEVVHRWRPRTQGATGETLTAYYKEIGARFELTSWQDMDEGKLQALLKS